jgi:hypothetical protein
MWCPNDKKDFFSTQQGQIIPEGRVGQLLIKTIQDPSLKNIVEIGTWNGMGSTRCFLLGLKDFSTFYTLETNQDKFNLAQKNLSSLIKPNVNFLWGSILTAQDIINPETIFPELLTNSEFRRWHSIDMENISLSPNVLSQIPSEIDFLLLDGGEFTTWYEFKILFSRCTKWIALDDVLVSKCKKIREYLRGHALWTETFIHERNGFSLFQKII